MKSWYFERDCPFCTRSASSFCRHPLNFLAHAMWMKWWYHANFQPFQSSFEMLFNFMVLLLKIISKCMKNNKWSQKGLKIDDVPLNGVFWTQKNYGVQISSRKWNPFVTVEFPYETLILRERLSVSYTKCIQFFRKPLYFLAHAMWVKWWYDANFQPFQSSFVVLFNFRVL